MVKKIFQCVFEIDSKDDEFNENGALVSISAGGDRQAHTNVSGWNVCRCLNDYRE